MQSTTTVKFNYFKIIILISLLFYLSPITVSARDGAGTMPATGNNVDRDAAAHNSAGGMVCCPKEINREQPLSGLKKQAKSIYGLFQVDRRETRDFILYNYAHVANDLINGSGIYLDTLYELLGIEECEKESWRKECLKTLIAKRRIPEFSNHIAANDNDF